MKEEDKKRIKDGEIVECPRCKKPVEKGPKAWIELRGKNMNQTGFEAQGYSCFHCNLTVWPYFITIGERNDG